jgi:hypothetical protein
MQKNHIYIVVLTAVVFGTASGFFSGLYTVKNACCSIVTADVKRLVEDKRQDLVMKFQDTKGENAPELEREYALFLSKLDSILDSYLEKEKNVLILRKEAVIDGNYRDITPEVKRAIEIR